MGSKRNSACRDTAALPKVLQQMQHCVQGGRFCSQQFRQHCWPTGSVLHYLCAEHSTAQHGRVLEVIQQKGFYSISEDRVSGKARQFLTSFDICGATHVGLWQGLICDAQPPGLTRTDTSSYMGTEQQRKPGKA